MSTLFRTGPSEHFTKIVLAGNRSSGYVPLAPRSKVPKTKDRPAHPLTSESMRVDFPQTGGLLSQGLRVTKGAFATTQARYAHTDVSFPNFEDYRRESNKDPTKPGHESIDQRRLFTQVTYGVGAMIGLYAAKTVVHGIVKYKAPARDALALAAVEINVAEIPEGKSQTFMWRGKPVFVRHRGQSEIEKERAVPVNSLRHPQHDDERVLRPEWLVVVGVCTHLGCVPIAGQGDFGGYYCPCHGSHYDASGRIRKGPAPLNLEVPEYYFKDDSTVIVGATG